jgi:hypothetical protein
VCTAKTVESVQLFLIECPLFKEVFVDIMPSKVVMGTTEGKNFWCSQFHTGHFTLLANQIDIFSLFAYMRENPRLTLFTLQLNQAVFYLLSVSDHQRSEPVNQDMQLQRHGTQIP